MTETNLLKMTLTCTRVFCQREEIRKTKGGTARLVEFKLGRLDLVGDGEGVAESRDRLSDLREREVEVVGTVSTGHLLLGLLAEGDDADLLALALTGLDVLLGGLGDGRVDTTAETTVGRSDDVEDLLDLGLGLGGLGLVEDGLVGGTVGLGTLHGALGASETGRGNHLRRGDEVSPSGRARAETSRVLTFIDLVILPERRGTAWERGSAGGIGCGGSETGERASLPDHGRASLARSSQPRVREVSGAAEGALTNVADRLDARLEFTERGLGSRGRREGSGSLGGRGGGAHGDAGRVEQGRHGDERGGRVLDGVRGGASRRGARRSAVAVRPPLRSLLNLALAPSLPLSGLRLARLVRPHAPLSINARCFGCYSLRRFPAVPLSGDRLNVAIYRLLVVYPLALVDSFYKTSLCRIRRHALPQPLLCIDSR